MTLVCRQCSRVNPEEAAYCYNDGAALAGRAGGPVNAGSAPFPNQFVFPNGTACRNFDQLATACQQNWSAAVDLLKQGFLGSFFGGLGRVDLAMAAQEAAQFPDIERGLDQLLAKLPTQALQPPKLQAEPSEINLGQIKIGQDRATELHLTNLGMRLCYGNVTSDCKWLTIGEAPGQPEKIFQFGSEQILPIQVRGQHLRAGTKPLVGHLTVDSNGGTVTVTVKADVPITPFKGGLFAGAVTPRQVAEKAKANPKEAAPYFEGGEVAAWYASNGWNYPVQGPIMSGMGAIQQFFEALGVAKPPKVDFSVKALDLQGSVGQSVQASIDVTTSERKVVYGWATCEQSWVEVGKTKLSGKNASIPITIRIPSPAPPLLETNLQVIGNGGQKAVVPLRVSVAGGRAGVVLQAASPAEEPVVVVPAPATLEVPDRARRTPMPAAPAPPPVQTPASPFAFSEAPVAVEATPAADDNPFAVTSSPPVMPGTAAPPADVATEAVPGAKVMPMPLRLAILLLPVAVLGTCLLGLVIRDILPSDWGGPPRRSQAGGEGGTTSVSTDDFAEAGAVDPKPHIKIVFDEGQLDKDYSDSMMFAVHKINPADPAEQSIRLNYYPNGIGNSVVARIDGRDMVFGKPELGGGSWPKGEGTAKDAGKYGGRTRTFEFLSGIKITQTVTYAPGDPVLVGKEYTRPINVCLARFKIVNTDKTRTHKVGLRILLDTCIGDNDGAPFTLPREKELVSTAKTFTGKDVPDFVQVLEKPDLSNPGTVVQLSLRLSDKLEMPSRFLLTRYPVTVTADKKSLNKWEVPEVPFGDDSSLVMYWDEKEMKPLTSREMGFAYGLGNLTAAPTARLAVSVGGALHVGGELTVVALVSDPNAKTATLQVPAGLEILDDPTQPVGPSRAGADGKYRPVPVTWRVRASAAGAHEITVSTDTALRLSRSVKITAKSLFN